MPDQTPFQIGMKAGGRLPWFKRRGHPDFERLFEAGTVETILSYGIPNDHAGSFKINLNLNVIGIVEEDPIENERSTSIRLGLL